MSNKAFYIFLFFIFSFGLSYSQVILPEPYAAQTTEGLIYNTKFQYKDNHVSGLLIIKKEQQGYHVVLLSKMGPTLMDFIITDKITIWNKSISIIEKPIILRAIEKDFRALLLTPLSQPYKVKTLKNRQYKVKKNINLKVKVDKDNKKVMLAETKSFINFFKSYLTYYYTNSDDVPDEICLVHRNVKLKIEMNQL